MIRIAISEAAFTAIARTLALGSVGFENPIRAESANIGLRTPSI